MPLLSEAARRASEAAADKWRSDYEKIASRFAGDAAAEARQPTTHAGLPIKPCYFPHDLDALDAEDVTAGPGAFPFVRGNLASWYQMMAWANQPVIGYGLPEDTRARMDALTKQGMVGYFGQPFYNLVYD